MASLWNVAFAFNAVIVHWKWKLLEFISSKNAMQEIKYVALANNSPKRTYSAPFSSSISPSLFSLSVSLSIGFSFFQRCPIRVKPRAYT